MSDTFDSARLTMRPQCIYDAEALFEAYSDTDLMRYWSSAPHADIAETRSYLAPRMVQDDQRGWVMIRKDDGRVIGTLWAGLRRPGVSEIGYMLVRAAWGQGYAREGVSRLIDLLIREETHRRVFADTDPDNDASNRLLESLGFQREGLLRAEWETHIGVRDTVLWGVLADEWMQRPPYVDPGDHARALDHRRHMDAVALPLRRTGIAFVMLGLALVLVRQLWIPAMPTVIPLATLGLGALNVIGGAMIRVMYDTRKSAARTPPTR